MLGYDGVYPLHPLHPSLCLSAEFVAYIVKAHICIYVILIIV